MRAKPNSIQTPRYKVFFIMGSLSLIVFGILYFLVEQRNLVYKKEFETLPKEGISTFSVLKEHFTKYKNQNRYDIFTYNIPDETGEILEVSEIVDPETRKLLRVGDTVECYRKAFWFEGRRVVLTKIKKNQAKFYEFDFMLEFSRIGIWFSLGVLGLGLICLAFKN